MIFKNRLLIIVTLLTRIIIETRVAEAATTVIQSNRPLLTIINKSNYPALIILTPINLQASPEKQFISIPGIPTDFPKSYLHAISARSYGQVSQAFGDPAGAILPREDKNYTATITCERKEGTLAFFSQTVGLMMRWKINLTQTQESDYIQTTTFHEAFSSRLQAVLETTHQIPHESAEICSKILINLPHVANKIINYKPIYPYNVLELNRPLWTPFDLSQIQNNTIFILQRVPSHYKDAISHLLERAANMIKEWKYSYEIPIGEILSTLTPTLEDKVK